MNIKYFAATRREQLAIEFGSNLLCQTLPSPLEPSFAAESPELRRLWQKSQLWWCEQNLQGALSVLLEISQTPGLIRELKIPTLFLAAHLHFHRDEAPQANRCIQSAVRIYTEETDFPPNGSNPLVTRSYALEGREWLILAISSLVRGDMESCLLWIHQAERDLQKRGADTEKNKRLQQHGDLHAILACIAAKSNEISEAEKALSIAYRTHVQAESFRSASRDLVLTARLAMLQDQRWRALSLLDAAECQLVLELPPLEFDRCPLVPIIQSDRAKLTSKDQQSAASQWN